MSTGLSSGRGLLYVLLYIYLFAVPFVISLVCFKRYQVSWIVVFWIVAVCNLVDYTEGVGDTFLLNDDNFVQ
jgi:hypothetical protein